MRAWLHAEVTEFVSAAEGLLRADPFTPNVIAVFAERVVANVDSSEPEHQWAGVGAVLRQSK